MQDLIINEIIYHMSIINQAQLATLCKQVKLNTQCIDTFLCSVKNTNSYVKPSKIPGKLIASSSEENITYYLTTHGLYSYLFGTIATCKYPGTIISLYSSDKTTFIIGVHNTKRYIMYCGNQIGTSIYHANFTKINVKDPLMVRQNDTLCVIASIYGIHVYVDESTPIFMKIPDIIGLSTCVNAIFVDTPTKRHIFHYIGTQLVEM